MAKFWRKLFCMPNEHEHNPKPPRKHVKAKQHVDVSGVPPKSVLKKPRIRSPKRIAISISDPGIAERGVRGLRGGGCGPSKIASPQQSPRNSQHGNRRRRTHAQPSRASVHTDNRQSQQHQSQATKRSAEDVMRAKLARKYPGYGTNQSATQAGANVLQPDSSARQFKGTGRYSRLMTAKDAIELADRSGSVRGIRGGCSVQGDDDSNVQPSRRVAIDQVSRLARRSINAASTVATRYEETVGGPEPASGSNAVGGEAQREQRRLTRQEPGAGRGEQRKRGRVFSRLKSFLCCCKYRSHEPPHVPHDQLRPEDTGTELQIQPANTASQDRLGAQEADETGTVIRRKPREASTEQHFQQTGGNSTAEPIPDRLPPAEQTSALFQDVDEITPVVQARSIGTQPQSRFSESSSSNHSGVSAMLDDAILVELQRQRIAEQDPTRYEELSDQYDQRLLQLMEAHGDERQNSAGSSSEQRWNLRGGQDESETKQPKVSLLAKVGRMLCYYSRDDQKFEHARPQQLDTFSSEPQSRPQSAIPYRYREPHPEGGGIGLALTIPEPRPATPSSILGIAPQSRNVSHNLDTIDQSEHDVTPLRPTIRRISEPAPTPSITWSRSVNERAQTRSATEPMIASSQQAQTEPSTPTRSEDPGSLSDSVQARRHRRSAAPLDGSENMVPLISSVMEKAPERQFNRGSVPGRREDESPGQVRQHGVQRNGSSRRLRIQATPQRPTSFTPFNSPAESSIPIAAFSHGSPKERPKSSIFPEQSPRL
ncbi:hypothetical protein HII31_08138 [Pseudocercospora fuligena]|uniref:Uncharacterized protein n=1 Tax=Pseudocercospora fuligena TaxID=685502 RepID=A0A8H6VJM8_9PEZI|nr:hypothetical protein HII31_08138 [Pseudocercospora fuligena]